MKNALKPLRAANARFRKAHPGFSDSRQPVHTVYGGAQLFTAQTAAKMGRTALETMGKHTPDARALSWALGQRMETPEQTALWELIHARVLEKLRREPVEDFRIDFEDGYGNRPDREEDGHAKSTALEVAKGMKDGTLPPFIGIRIKSFSDECVSRSTRTLDLFLTTLLDATKRRLPPNFVVTLPKITVAEQSATLARLLSAIERKNRLKAGTLKFELMVETPQSILGADGRCPLRAFVEAGEGRCVAAHFGTYDYTAGLDITAAHQTMTNPVCDFAKHVMQVQLAGTPVFLSDGATNVMPVGDAQAVHRAWQLSYTHIQHSLSTGFYQGWDLHPAQLPVRYAAVYAFFLESLKPTQSRLKAFVAKAAKATLLGDVFDDAATGQGLLNFFLRALSCGAITEAEALETGLSLKELQSRSFLRILEGRKLV